MTGTPLWRVLEASTGQLTVNAKSRKVYFSLGAYLLTITFIFVIAFCHVPSWSTFRAASHTVAYSQNWFRLWISQTWAPDGDFVSFKLYRNKKRMNYMTVMSTDLRLKRSTEKKTSLQPANWIGVFGISTTNCFCLSANIPPAYHSTAKHNSIRSDGADCVSW